MVRERYFPLQEIAKARGMMWKWLRDMKEVDGVAGWCWEVLERLEAEEMTLTLTPTERGMGMGWDEEMVAVAGGDGARADGVGRGRGKVSRMTAVSARLGLDVRAGVGG